MGFVTLKPISITPMGERLLSGKRINETFTRQLMKFQLPSPYHTDSEDRFSVKPYLEMMRLVRDLDGITKHELAIFGLQLININRYDGIVEKIKKFREEKSKHKYTAKRKFI